MFCLIVTFGDPYHTLLVITNTYICLPTGSFLCVLIMIIFIIRDYSPYVADVFVFRRKGGRGQPLFGKVVFKNTDSPDKIMQNRGKAFFYVEGRPLWCRRWVSKKKETTASASDSLRDGGSHHGGD